MAIRFAEIDTSAGIQPFENCAASSFAGFLELSDATPREAELWLLAAVNHVRSQAIGVPALTLDEMWTAIFDVMNSMRDAAGEPPVDRSHVDMRRANLAGLLLLVQQVFGLAFAPSQRES